jgi:histidinol phosphatase-like enzyme (inositol monophosphatase family)
VDLFQTGGVLSDNLKQRLEVATDAARRAGAATLKYFQTDLEVETKPDRSPVTVADREAEETIRSFLLEEYPQDTFVGEERGTREGSSSWRWIVDPIDGTKSFVHGVPLYGVLIGLEDGAGEVVLGVVYLPGLDELVRAARGEGCWWNGKRAQVSDTAVLEEASVCLTSLDSFKNSGQRGALEVVWQRARQLRGWGDCYGHVLVATGRVDVMLDPILNEWDCAALLPILEEAGGSFTDWSGQRTHRGGSGISTNGKIDASLRAALDDASAAGSPADGPS